MVGWQPAALCMLANEPEALKTSSAVQVLFLGAYLGDSELFMVQARAELGLLL